MQRKGMVAWFLAVVIASGNALTGPLPARAQTDCSAGASATAPAGIGSLSVGHPDIQSPKSGTVVSDAQITVSGKANQSDEVKVDVGSRSYDATINSDQDTFSASGVTLDEDKNTIKARGFLGSWHDGGGVVVYYLPKPGAVSVTSANAVTSSAYALTGTYGAHTTRVMVSDGSADRRAALRSDGTFSMSLTLHAGSQSFTIRPYNDSSDGNAASAGDALGFTVTLQTSGPARPSITAPADGQVFSSVPAVSGGDPSSGATVHLYSGNVEAGSASVSDQNAWQVGAPSLVDDQNVLRARAEKDGQQSDWSNSATIYYLQSPGKPGIHSSVGTTTTDSSAVISGTVGDHTNRVRVVVGDSTITASLSGGQYSATVSLAMGANTVTAYADHVSSHDSTKYTSTASDSLTITRQSHSGGRAPEITAPKDDSVMSEGSVSVSGLAHDATSVQIHAAPAGGGDERVYDAQIDQDAGTFRVDGVKLSDDRTRLEAWGDVSSIQGASKGAAPMETKRGSVLYVYYLAKPGSPSVTSASETDDETYTLQGKIGVHTNRLVVTLGSSQFTAAIDKSGSFQAQFHLNEGANALILTPYHDSADGRHAVTGDNIGFTVTRTSGPAAPVITAPTDGALLPTLPDATGTEPTTGATVRIYRDGSDLPLGSATAGADHTWRIGAPPLLEDRNTMRARAEKSGKESAWSQPVTVYYLPTPDRPDARASAVDEDAGTATISGKVGGHTTRVRLKAGEDWVTATLSGQSYQATVHLAVGDNTVAVYAENVSRVDSSKFTATAGPTLTITRGAIPAPNIESPADGSVLEKHGATVSGTVRTAGAQVSLYAGDKVVGTTDAGTDGRWSLTVSLPDDRSILTAQARTADGRISSRSLAATVYVLIPPAQPRVELPTAQVTESGLVLVSARVDQNTTTAWVYLQPAGGPLQEAHAELRGFHASARIPLPVGTTQFWVVAEHHSRVDPEKLTTRQGASLGIQRLPAKPVTPEVQTPPDLVLRTDSLAISGRTVWNTSQIRVYAGGRVAACTNRLEPQLQPDGTFGRSFTVAVPGLQQGGNVLQTVAADASGVTAPPATLRLFYLPQYTAIGFNVTDGDRPVEGMRATLYSMLQKKVVQTAQTDRNGQVIFDYTEPQDVLWQQRTAQVQVDYRVTFFHTSRDRLGLATYSVHYQTRQEGQMPISGGGHSAWQAAASTRGDTVSLFHARGHTAAAGSGTRQTATAADESFACHDDENVENEYWDPDLGHLYMCSKVIDNAVPMTVEFGSLPAAVGLTNTMDVQITASTEFEVSGEIGVESDSGLIAVQVGGGRTIKEVKTLTHTLRDDGQPPDAETDAWTRPVLVTLQGPQIQYRTNFWQPRAANGDLTEQTFVAWKPDQMYDWSLSGKLLYAVPAWVMAAAHDHRDHVFGDEYQHYGEVENPKEKWEWGIAVNVEAKAGIKLGTKAATGQIKISSKAGKELKLSATSEVAKPGSGRCYLVYQDFDLDLYWPHISTWTQSMTDADGVPRKCDPYLSTPPDDNGSGSNG